MKHSSHSAAKDGEDLTPDRLFESSNAVLKALSELKELTGQSVCYPPDLLGTTLQPRCLSGFTRHEIHEATHFLVRLGVLTAIPKQR